MTLLGYNKTIHVPHTQRQNGEDDIQSKTPNVLTDDMQNHFNENCQLHHKSITVQQLLQYKTRLCCIQNHLHVSASSQVNHCPATSSIQDKPLLYSEPSSCISFITSPSLSSNFFNTRQASVVFRTIFMYHAQKWQRKLSVRQLDSYTSATVSQQCTAAPGAKETAASRSASSKSLK